MNSEQRELFSNRLRELTNEEFFEMYNSRSLLNIDTMTAREYLDRKPIVEAEMYRRFVVNQFDEEEVPVGEKVIKWDRKRVMHLLLAIKEEAIEPDLYYFFDEDIDRAVNSFVTAGYFEVYNAATDEYDKIRPKSIIVTKEIEAYRKLHYVLPR